MKAKMHRIEKNIFKIAFSKQIPVFYVLFLSGINMSNAAIKPKNFITGREGGGGGGTTKIFF